MIILKTLLQPYTGNLTAIWEFLKNQMFFLPLHVQAVFDPIKSDTSYHFLKQHNLTDRKHIEMTPILEDKK